MTLEIGATLPAAIVHIKDAEGVQPLATTDYFKGRRIGVFVVPGAFTPTCSARHLPGFLDHADELKSAGLDAIACLSVNDAHVMKAWAEASAAEGVIDMLADMRADFASALGLAVDMGPVMGQRATRCSFVVDDNVVTHLFIEEPGAFEVSSAEHLLAALTG